MPEGRERKTALEMDQIFIILLTLRDLMLQKFRAIMCLRAVLAALRAIGFSDEYAHLYTLDSEHYQEENSTVSLYVSSTRGSDVFTYEDILVQPARDK